MWFHLDKLAEYIEKNIKQINETVDIIFVEEEAEKNSLYKSIEKNGEVIEFTELKLPELISNIKKICNAYKEKKKSNINNGEFDPGSG